MTKSIACAAAFLLLGPTLRAGELDAEFGPKATGPAKAVAASKAPVAGADLTKAVAAKSSELDAEAPALAWRHGFGGFGGFHRGFGGWGRGFGGWGRGFGYGGWGRGFGYGWGYRPWGWGLGGFGLGLGLGYGLGYGLGGYGGYGYGGYGYGGLGYGYGYGGLGYGGYGGCGYGGFW